MWKLILSCCTVLIGCLASATVLSRVSDFSGTAAPSGWSLQKYGDAATECVASSGVQILRNPTAQAWGYLIRNFSPEELGDAAKVRLTIEICSNRPELVLAVIAEGVAWGGDYQRLAAQAGQTPLAWETIVVELERFNRENLMSVALGLDYNREGVWLAIGDIKVEALDAAAAPVAPGEAPERQLQLPSEWLQAEIAACGEKHDAYLRYRERLQHAGLLPEAPPSPPGNPTASGISAWRELAELSRHLDTWQYSIQGVDALAQFDGNTPLPELREDTLTIALASNAHELALLLMSNNTDVPAEFVLELSGAAAALLQSHTLREVEGVPDCLVPLAADGVVEIGGRRLTGIALTCNSKGIEAGIYPGSLTIRPFDGRWPEHTIQLQVEVFPVALPEQMPIQVMQWDYAKGLEKSLGGMLAESRVNVFHIPLQGEISAANFAIIGRAAEYYDRLVGRGNYQLFFETWFVRNANGWKAEFEAWLPELVNACEAAGLKYEDWYLHIYDELLNDEFLSAAQAIKRSNPAIRIFSDKLVAEPETVQEFIGAVDVWSPISRGLRIATEHNQDAFQVMRESGLPIWCYNCDAVPAQSLVEYRLQPYLAWAEKLDGISFWMASPVSYRKLPTARNYGMCYPAGAGQYYWSRRWYQWMIGLEDYLLLQEAEQAGLTVTEKATELLRNPASPATGNRLEQFKLELLQTLKSHRPHGSEKG